MLALLPYEPISESEMGRGYKRTGLFRLKSPALSVLSDCQ